MPLECSLSSRFFQIAKHPTLREALIMKIWVLLASVILMTNASANNSKAKAEWILEKNEITPGETIRTVIRMTVNEGWHTYWINPGEGGMELSLRAKLPDGWTIGELQYPVPKRFMTGELAGFGYEGEIDFPITITPPADTSGSLPPLKASLDWLTCNDDSCVPGDAELVIPGKTDPQAVAKAYSSLPQPIGGAELIADFKNGRALLSLTLPENFDSNPSEFEVFPVTSNLLDPSAKTHFTKEGGSGAWIAKIPESEYISEEREKLELLLVAPNGKSWLVSEN